MSWPREQQLRFSLRRSQVAACGAIPWPLDSTQQLFINQHSLIFTPSTLSSCCNHQFPATYQALSCSLPKAIDIRVNFSKAKTHTGNVESDIFFIMAAQGHVESIQNQVQLSISLFKLRSNWHFFFANFCFFWCCLYFFCLDR